jgi:hypothetical protein
VLARLKPCADTKTWLIGVSARHGGFAMTASEGLAVKKLKIAHASRTEVRAAGQKIRAFIGTTEVAP